MSVDLRKEHGWLLRVDNALDVAGDDLSLLAQAVGVDAATVRAVDLAVRYLEAAGDVLMARMGELRALLPAQEDAPSAFVVGQDGLRYVLAYLEIRQTAPSFFAIGEVEIPGAVMFLGTITGCVLHLGEMVFEGLQMSPRFLGYRREKNETKWNVVLSTDRGLARAGV